MLRITLLLLLLCISARSITGQKQCMEGYTPMGDGRCVRVLELNVEGTLGDMHSAGVAECKKDGAYLPIVRSDQENEMFTEIVNVELNGASVNPFIILGLVCNKTTRRFEWEDGSQPAYTKDDVFDYHKYDCVKKGDLVFSSTNWNSSWFIKDPRFVGWFTVLCVEGNECGDYDAIANPTDEKHPCFKINSFPLGWNDAQAKCSRDFGSLATINSATENKFIWRSALSNRVIYALHIGAHQPDNQTPSVWTWIDDNKTISIDVYQNFASGFPLPVAGSCSFMVIETPDATWQNTDCNTVRLPFVCRRLAHSIEECPTKSPEKGKDIVPPGFPFPNMPCEYTLIVEPGNIVWLQVFVLEADAEFDALEIYEGADGDNLIARLTGSNPIPTSYSTVSSNIMRVNWKTSNQFNGYRGFRIRYYGVIP